MSAACAVIDVDFEEVSIEVHGVHVGLFDGTAYVDSDGAVTGIRFDGWKDGQRTCVRLDVPARYSNRPTWNGTFALVIADEIQRQYADTIREKLDDWVDSLSNREAAE